MPRSPGRHRRPAPAPLTALSTPVEASTAVGPVVPAGPMTEPAAADAAVAEPARRRPGRVAVATAGGTGAVALAIALLTVAAGPARNGDPTHHQPLAGPSGVPSAGPSSTGSTSTGADRAAGQDASLGRGAVVLAAAQQRSALPVAPSTAPPMAGPTAAATPAASSTPTKPGQRRGASHHTPTPTPTPSGTSDAQAADLGLLPLPTLP